MGRVVKYEGMIAGSKGGSGDIGEFEKKLEKARAKVAHYTVAENGEKIAKWTGRVAKYEQRIVEMNAGQAETYGGGEVGDMGMDEFAPPPEESETSIEEPPEEIPEEIPDVPTAMADDTESAPAEGGMADEEIVEAPEIAEKLDEDEPPEPTSSHPETPEVDGSPMEDVAEEIAETPDAVEELDEEKTSEPTEPTPEQAEYPAVEGGNETDAADTVETQ